jgi:hypothetical protein
MDVLAWLWAVAAGVAALFLFFGRGSDEPRWAPVALRTGFGAVLGMGSASALFVLRVMVAPGAPRVSPVLELLVDAAVLALGWRAWKRRASAETVVKNAGRAAWPLAAMLAFEALCAGSAFSDLVTANPEGNWDAWAIWNLRARFLAAPDAAAQLAYSARLHGTHPGYPLLLPGFIARCWSYAGESGGTIVPMLAAASFFAALVLIAAGAVTVLRGARLGLLFCLCLVAYPPLVREAAAQYADVPLACYAFGALTALAVALKKEQPGGWLALAGALASCAAWTKNEGILFFAVLAAIVLVRLRSAWGQAAWFVAGAAPVALLTAWFKLFIAPRDEPPLFLAGLGEPARWAIIGRGLWHEMDAMASGWYYPAMPLAVAGIALGFGGWKKRGLWLPAIAAVAMALGDLAAYVMNPGTTWNGSSVRHCRGCWCRSGRWRCSHFSWRWGRNRPRRWYRRRSRRNQRASAANSARVWRGAQLRRCWCCLRATPGLRDWRG